jgi:1-phosphofructokinase family hexose kinase
VIVCVAPNPSVDKLFGVERLEPGAIHRPTSFVAVPGGKGLNVARAAASLGGDVHAVALLGGGTGRWIADELERMGIETTAVWHSGETRSCLSVADAATTSLTEFYEDGIAVEEGIWRSFARAVLGAADAASWVTVSGSLPPGAPEDGYAELEGTASLAVDATRLGNVRPALVKVNADEAGRMTGLEDPVAAAHELHTRYGGAAVVTSRAGAVLVDADGGARQGGLDVEGPYPVGSGDAFLAGLVVALDRGAGWDDALKGALGAGGANAHEPGAGNLVRSHAEELAEKAYVVRMNGTRET